MRQLLPSDQRVMLANAVLDAFPEISGLGIFTRTRLGRNLDEFSRGPLPELIDAIVTTYEAAGRTQLVVLLTQFTLLPNPLLSGVASGLIDKLPAAPFFEPFEHEEPCQSLFPRAQALLDRETVRLHVGELLLQNGGPRTLIVDGPSPTGKTHTYELVRHVAAVGNPPFRYVYVDLRGDVHGGYDAGELMRTIARKIHLDVKAMPDKQAQTTRWLRDLRDWFIGELNDQDESLWVVIDGVSQVDPIQDVRDMISMLVSEAEQNTDMLRLVLLGCADEAIIQSGKKVVRATLTPFGSDDVHAFIATACKRAKIPIDSSAIDEGVAFVMSDLPVEARSRLEAIGRKTETATKAILKGR